MSNWFELLTSVNALPKSPDSCYLCIVKAGKSYLLPLLAGLTMVAMAAYEFYWIRGLYKTRRDTAESAIRVSITWAEMEEFTARGRHSEDTVLVTSRVYSSDNFRISRIITSKFSESGDSLRSITVTKPDVPIDPDAFLSGVGQTDLHVMDSILSHRLDSLGLPLAHRLALVSDSAVLAECQSPDYVPSSRDVRIQMSSITNHGAGFDLWSEPLTLALLKGMKGVLLMSVGILLVLALVLWMMMRALRGQRELDRMKSDFTSNMTHELKTPIAVACAANDAMLVYGLDKDPEKREEYLRVTRESLEKLSGMVEQILSMSMEEREGLALRLERTGLRPLLESAASQARLSAAKPCDISVEVTPASLSADLDASLMSSVIATLLDNALKYSGESVKISMKAEERDGRAIISVSDNGIGIAPDKQAHIFEKFYRVPTGDVHNVKGYGIGLYFAKTIVEKHGGRISVHSAPGKGSIFTISIPSVILNEVKNL